MVDREFRADSRSRDELIDNLTAEMKRIRDKLNEFKIQIDQTQLVVDREQQRNNDVFTELRTVQDNIETIPRQDIRTKYDEAIEARFRLTTMRVSWKNSSARANNWNRNRSFCAICCNAFRGSIWSVHLPAEQRAKKQRKRAKARSI